MHLISALYGVIFKNNAEAAFSNYRLWESLGFLLAYLLQTRVGHYLSLGASIYDVRRGWGEGVPKKQTKGTRLRESGHDKGEGVKKSENVADVIYGSPLARLAADR